MVSPNILTLGMHRAVEIKYHFMDEQEKQIFIKEHIDKFKFIDEMILPEGYRVVEALEYPDHSIGVRIEKSK